MKTIAALCTVVLIAVPTVAFAANGALYVSPARGTYTMDDVFEVDVVADTDGESSNAAEADISFNPEALTVDKILTDHSVLSLWPTPPEFSNTKGTIRFSGTAASAFSGKDALLVKIMFRATSNLPGDVRIDSGAILKNDARATNIITSMRSGLYTIVAHQAAPAESETPQVSADTATATPAVKGAAIQVPSISGYDDRIAVGSRIILQGSASPDTALSVYVQHDDDAPVAGEVLTNREGSFTFVSREGAQAGIYHAWAEVKTPSETLTSDKVVMTAQSDGLVASAAAVGSVLTMLLPYLMLVIAAGVSLGFLYNRRTRR